MFISLFVLFGFCHVIYKTTYFIEIVGQRNFRMRPSTLSQKMRLVVIFEICRKSVNLFDFLVRQIHKKNIRDHKHIDKSIFKFL